MKISELEAQLKAHREKHGDIPVYMQYKGIGVKGVTSATVAEWSSGGAMYHYIIVLDIA